MTTQTDLAHTLSIKLDITEEAASEALDLYIQQVEAEDNRGIDPDDISQEDAEFLIEAVKSAQRSGSMGIKELEEIPEAHIRYREALDGAESARLERDTIIRRALAAGVRVTDIANAVGMSRNAVYKIADRI